MLVSTCLVASALAMGATKVAVFTLEAGEDLRPLAGMATEEIVLHLGRQSGIVVLSETEIDVLLSQKEDLQGFRECEGSEACLAKVTEAADAEKLLAGRLGRWGLGYIATLNVLDAKRSAVERGDSVTAESQEELLRRLPETAAQLLLGTGTSTLTAAATFTATASKGVKVAVFDLAAYDVGQELSKNLTQLLSLELRRLGLEVISREEVATMLQYETDKRILACSDDVSCLVEIGGALGAEYLVSGALGRLSDTLVIHLKLMNIQRAVVVNRISESFRGPEPQLSAAIRFAAAALLGHSRRGTGALVVETDPDDAEASVDGGAPMTLPLASPLAGLPVGKHALTIKADGYYDAHQDIYIEPDQVARAQAELKRVPKWYHEWWPWTIAGVVVAAGVTAAVVSTQSPDSGTVDVIVRE